MGFVRWASLLVGCAVAWGAVAHADDAASVKERRCARWEGLKVIRGFCPDDYVRQDVLDEVAHAAVDLAFEKYFPLVLRRSDVFSYSAQIRHDETPLRSRKWRGEFVIRIREEGTGFAASFARAKRPLWVQAHALVHEKHYNLIADAFERTALAAGDKVWADEVRRLLPSVEVVADAIEVERLATDSRACEALGLRVQALAGIAPEPVFERKGGDLITVPVHPESYEVVVADYPRALYTTDTSPDSAYFKWAEGTVQALESCWKQLAN